MLREYLRQQTEGIEGDFPGPIHSAEAWKEALPRFRREYLEMLGLQPEPERTPLRATITRTLDRGDYVVDMVHYQSRPGLYVTGNLYRPARSAPGERLPAIFYVCGHTSRGRDGNKTAYQAHGAWFARHGYLCLIVDTLQMGEIPGVHHGTYREGRWWWASRGYTPAGVECWSGIRGLDYLLSRPDADPRRLGVTGISGGGAATFWIAAADERVAVAAAISGMSDLRDYVIQRTIKGHCDCMFFYNLHQWPWTQIAALVAPRPLLFVNSDADPLFPMDGNERVINRLESVYSLFGAGDRVDAVVSMGGHAYRQDIRQAVFRFFNIHFKQDPRPVLDSEVDLVTGDKTRSLHPIPPQSLRVFPQDTDLPPDARNGDIDREFVPLATPEPCPAGGFEAWSQKLLDRLRELTFRRFPERIPPARLTRAAEGGVLELATEPGITIRLRKAQTPEPPSSKVWLVVAPETIDGPPPAWVKRVAGANDTVYLCEPRGGGITPGSLGDRGHTIERSHLLLGRTLADGQIWDLIAAARYLGRTSGAASQMCAAGEGAGALLAAYAALLEPEIGRVSLIHPPATHMDDAAPTLLNVLRVCDVPEVVGMLAPRPLLLLDSSGDLTRRAAAVYEAAGALGNLARGE